MVGSRNDASAAHKCEGVKSGREIPKTTRPTFGKIVIKRSRRAELQKHQQQQQQQSPERGATTSMTEPDPRGLLQVFVCVIDSAPLSYEGVPLDAFRVIAKLSWFSREPQYKSTGKTISKDSGCMPGMSSSTGESASMPCRPMFRARSSPLMILACLIMGRLRQGEHFMWWTFPREGWCSLLWASISRRCCRRHVALSLFRRKDVCGEPLYDVCRAGNFMF